MLALHFGLLTHRPRLMPQYHFPISKIPSSFFVILTPKRLISQVEPFDCL